MSRDVKKAGQFRVIRDIPSPDRVEKNESSQKILFYSQSTTHFH